MDEVGRGAAATAPGVLVWRHQVRVFLWGEACVTLEDVDMHRHGCLAGAGLRCRAGGQGALSPETIAMEG
jgi:hypothetical protein